ncbi:MAG: iron donor protein CyaY [Acidobacteria bacterium]|nr:iron donor protein CyaY [Acidobacteriota bacterium]
MTEQEFRLEADRALDEALRALVPLAERRGFDVDLHNGVLQLAFDSPSPAKFVASPHGPARQIWVSALGRAYRLAWHTGSSAFVLAGEALPALLERLTLAFLDSRPR